MLNGVFFCEECSVIKSKFWKRSLYFYCFPYDSFVYGFFNTNVTVLQNHVNCRSYVATCERNGGMIMRAVVYFKYSVYCPDEVMKSANFSVGLLLWSEQTISHSRVSLVILCCFISCENIYPRCLEKMRKSSKNVTVNCLFVTVRATLLSLQSLESFSKVVRTLCVQQRDWRVGF